MKDECVVRSDKPNLVIYTTFQRIVKKVSVSVLWEKF